MKIEKIGLYTLLTVLIFSAGLIREYIYYKYFGFSILPHISIDEITILVFDAILYSSTYFILLIFPFLSSNLQSTRYRLLFFFITAIIAVIVNLKFEGFYCYEAIAWIIMLFYAFFINPKLINKLENSDINLMPTLHHFDKVLILFTSYLLILSIGFGLNEGIKTCVFGYTKGVNIHMDDDSIMASDSSSFFLGANQEYVFYYIKNQKATLTISRDRVKMISYAPR